MVCRGLTCRTGSYLFNLQKQAIQVYGINSADHSWMKEHSRSKGGNPISWRKAITAVYTLRFP